MIDSEELYALTKARPAMLACVRNLAAAKGRPYALPKGTPPRQGTAVVVGSGPSLDESLEHVRALAGAGAVIYTTNTGLSALARAGIVPDVVIAREVLDVRSHLDHPHVELVLDLATNADVWAAHTAASWFVAGGTQFFQLASRLGVRPLFGGPASLTAAVALADARGAERIILVGVDLAFASDGIGYASGSAFAGLEGEFANGSVTLDSRGLEAMKRASDAVGVPAPPRVQRVTETPGLNGSTVRQLGTWADQQRWLEMFSTRARAVLLDNLTAHGASLAGWQRLTTAPRVSRRTFWSESDDERATPLVDEALADIARQADTVASLADTVRDADGCVVAVPGYLDGCDVVEAAAAGDLITVRRMGYAPGPGVRLTCAALASAAEAVREALAAGRCAE